MTQSILQISFVFLNKNTFLFTNYLVLHIVFTCRKILLINSCTNTSSAKSKDLTTFWFTFIIFIINDILGGLFGVPTTDGPFVTFIFSTELFFKGNGVP